MGSRSIIRRAIDQSRTISARVLMLAAVTGSVTCAAEAQPVDCAQLQRQIAQSGQGGNRYAQAARRQSAELARTQAYARQLGCNGFSFFGGDPQCASLSARINQMQANLAQLQGMGSDGGRGELVARFNAYCRGGQPAPQQPRGFFDTLFGIRPPPPPPPEALPQAADGTPADGDGLRVRGGSQAVCVRTCDGGFFPLGISARHRSEDLTQMCQALCPGTDTAVYTRNPDADIKTAASLDGKSYMDLPNALHFQKSFTAACTCRPAGKSWAEALANAEEVLDSTRKGDIVVTPEKSAEMSRPKIDPAVRRSALDPATTSSTATDAAPGSASAATADGKKTVRQVGPQL